MVARLTAGIEPLLRPGGRRAAHAHVAGAVRRRRARLAVACGGLLFLLFTLALEGAAETVRPEWRDPEYGRRLRQIRHWQKERPHRPVVLFVGSSRVQQGVSPAAMGFADEAGSPLPYNLGVRGALPVAVWLQVARALDDDIRPRAVVVMIAANEIREARPAEEQLRRWPSRLSRADLRRLAPFAADPAALRRAAAEARRDPWAARSELLIDDLLPLCELPANHFHHTAWARMDAYGFSPYPVEYADPGARERTRGAFLATQPATLDCPPGDVSARADRAVLTRCRAEGVAAALCWAPESPSYRAIYAPRHRAADDAFAAALAAEFGVAVFPAPGHLGEGDFVDPVHLTPGGAEKYSRWLADNHLKPWLARVLK
jgi:hypothetical protein